MYVCIRHTSCYVVQKKYEKSHLELVGDFLPLDAMRKRGLLLSTGVRLCICPSVCLSVCHVRALYPDGWRYRQKFLDPVAHYSIFWPDHRYTIPISAGRKIHGKWEKFAIFDWSHRLSRKKTMSQFRTVSEINGDFSRKSQFFHFPTVPCIMCLRWRDFPWNWVPALGIKKLEWWGYRAEKKVWHLQPSGYNTPTWQTDGWTDGHQPTAKTALTHRVAR